VPVGAPAVGMVLGLLHGHEVQAAVTHAGLGRQAAGELAHGGHGSLQHCRLEAVLVVEMHVHGRDDQVVMRVLALGDPFGEIARMVVVDIRETRDAVAVGRVVLRLAVELLADQVAHGFAAVLVATPGDQPVEAGGELVVEGYGDALHGASLLHTRCPMRVIAACAIALLLALIVYPPALPSTAWMGGVHDAGHVLVFAVITALLCVILRPRGARLAVIAAMIVLLAAGTELAQGRFGVGDATFGDFGRDLLGGAVGVTLWFAATRRLPALHLVAALALLAGLLPLARIGWAYAQRADAPHVIWDPRRATWDVFIESPRTGTFSKLPDGQGVRFVAGTDSYAGIVIREPPPDWRGFDALIVSVANPGSRALSLNVRIDDLPRDTDYEDRFNRERVLPPGAALRWRIPLAEIEQGPRGRPLGLSHITRVVIFLSPGYRGAEFDLRDVRLEPAP